jgi:hypothetical protein
MKGDGQNYLKEDLYDLFFSLKIIVVKCREGMGGTYSTHGRYELDVNKCGIDNVYVSMSFGELIYIHVFLCVVL